MNNTFNTSWWEEISRNDTHREIYNLVVEIMPKSIQKHSLVDICSGSGEFMRLAMKKGFLYSVGIDLSIDALETADKKLRQEFYGRYILLNTDAIKILSGELPKDMSEALEQLKYTHAVNLFPGFYDRNIHPAIWENMIEVYAERTGNNQDSGISKLTAEHNMKRVCEDTKDYIAHISLIRTMFKVGHKLLLPHGCYVGTAYKCYPEEYFYRAREDMTVIRDTIKRLIGRPDSKEYPYHLISYRFVPNNEFGRDVVESDERYSIKGLDLNENLNMITGIEIFWVEKL